MTHKSKANRAHHDQATFWDRVADGAAGKIGSWAFIGGQAVFTMLWLILNSIHGWAHWDRYPFVLLNLVYSFQAGFTGPVLLLANNRQSAHDRLVAEETYETGAEVKALLTVNNELTAQVKASTDVLDRLAIKFGIKPDPWDATCDDLPAPKT